MTAKTETPTTGGRPKGFKMSAATKAKLAKAMKARWRRARKDGKVLSARKQPLNGHHADSNAKRKTARTELIDLAKMGARIRLTELERETAKLRIFLGESGSN